MDFILKHLILKSDNSAVETTVCESTVVLCLFCVGWLCSLMASNKQKQFSYLVWKNFGRPYQRTGPGMLNPSSWDEVDH